MSITQLAPLPFAPSIVAGHGPLSAEEHEELCAWLDSLPPAAEQCEACGGPASPCIAGRCLACSAELDPTLPLPWEHGA